MSARRDSKARDLPGSSLHHATEYRAVHGNGLQVLHTAASWVAVTRLSYAVALSASWCSRKRCGAARVRFLRPSFHGRCDFAQHDSLRVWHASPGRPERRGQDLHLLSSIDRVQRAFPRAARVLVAQSLVRNGSKGVLQPPAPVAAWRARLCAPRYSGRACGWRPQALAVGETAIGVAARHEAPADASWWAASPHGGLAAGDKGPGCHGLGQRKAARYVHGWNMMPGGFRGSGNPPVGWLRLGISF